MSYTSSKVPRKFQIIVVLYTIVLFIVGVTTMQLSAYDFWWRAVFTVLVHASLMMTGLLLFFRSACVQQQQQQLQFQQLQ